MVNKRCFLLSESGMSGRKCRIPREHIRAFPGMTSRALEGFSKEELEN